MISAHQTRLEADIERGRIERQKADQIMNNNKPGRCVFLSLLLGMGCRVLAWAGSACFGWRETSQSEGRVQMTLIDDLAKQMLLQSRLAQQRYTSPGPSVRVCRGACLQ